MKSYNSYIKLVYYSLKYFKFRYIKFLDCVNLLEYYIINFTLLKIVIKCLKLFMTSLSLNLYNLHIV